MEIAIIILLIALLGISTLNLTITIRNSKEKQPVVKNQNVTLENFDEDLAETTVKIFDYMDKKGIVGQVMPNHIGVLTLYHLDEKNGSTWPVCEMIAGAEEFMKAKIDTYLANKDQIQKNILEASNGTAS